MLQRGPLPPTAARSVAEQLCRALGSAHAQGVVHCDVKPGNVLIASTGAVKVGDFGVARLGDATSQGLPATIAGTPRYMSPEQAGGRRPTAATDVYSAGVVLYEMLVGEPPFASTSAVQLGIQHLHERPPELPRDVPEELRAIVRKALAKRPAARYRDGGEMADALSHADRGARGVSPVSAPETVGGARRPPGAGVSRARTAPDALTVKAPERRPAASATVKLDARTVLSSPRRRWRSVKRRRIVLLGALPVLALAALAALLHGGATRTTVPELRGLPRGGVLARARRMHLSAVFSRRHATVVPVGLAISQSPAPGARVGAGSRVDVVLSAGPPPITVPDVVGQAASGAEQVLAGTGLRYAVTAVPAPGSAPGSVIAQAPSAAASAPPGSTVSLTVAEKPRWRPLLTFAGTDGGHSAPFRVKGGQWRVTYGMHFVDTCLLLVYCMGPSAQAQNLRSGTSFGGFELGEGDVQEHVFHGGPGLYTVSVSGGRDSAQWSMTVEDYY
jgi:serine/threonine-protein kinase